MSDLDLLAEDLGITGRTLRRAISRGLVRGTVEDRRRYDIAPSERRYVRRHWKLLQSLLGVLRTEPNIRLAVLFGSLARGEGGAESDLDLLVDFQRPERLSAADLSLKLTERLGRRVQIVSLEQAEGAPVLLRDILRQGRVLVDRAGDWSRISRRAPTVDRLADREEERLERSAWQTLDALAR
jgi:predicted nucleotidyltransferase